MGLRMGMGRTDMKIKIRLFRNQNGIKIDNRNRKPLPTTFYFDKGKMTWFDALYLVELNTVVP